MQTVHCIIVIVNKTLSIIRNTLWEWYTSTKATINFTVRNNKNIIPLYDSDAIKQEKCFIKELFITLEENEMRFTVTKTPEIK